MCHPPIALEKCGESSFVAEPDGLQQFLVGVGIKRQVNFCLGFFNNFMLTYEKKQASIADSMLLRKIIIFFEGTLGKTLVLPVFTYIDA